MNVCKRGLLNVHTTSPQVIDENEPDEDNGYDGDIDSFDIFHSNSDICGEESSETTAYKLERLSNVAGWNAVRNGLLMAAVENAAMPDDQLCVYCNNNTASLRCQRCGSHGYYCQSCFKALHSSSMNLFHFAEEWTEVGIKYIQV